MFASPIEVTQHHPNLVGRDVLIFVSRTLTIILLAVTIEIGRREAAAQVAPPASAPSHAGR
jgi:hypothetical protein